MRSSAIRFEALAAAVLAIAACGRSTGATTDEFERVIARPIGAVRVVDSNTGAVLSRQASALDFGAVAVGTSLGREVVIRNIGLAAFTVTDIERVHPFPSAFEVAASSFSVDPGRQFSLAITFAPTSVDEIRGTIQLNIENADQSVLRVDLSGSGLDARSPRLQVEPSPLDFGDVAPDTWMIRNVVLMNVGIDDPETDQDNLLLGVADSEGDWTEQWPEITGPDAADFSLEWPLRGLDKTGLSEGRSAELGVRFWPRFEGLKRATLAIYSNDRNQPRTEVPLRGRAPTLPPCEFLTRPPVLSFVSEPNKPLTSSFEIVNIASDPTRECLISMLDLTQATADAGVFALPNGPIESATLRGGDVLAIPVRFQPQAKSTFEGEVDFFSSSPWRPVVRVRLLGVATAVP